ncbi:hypothetical protein KQI42_12600 [Tissierella sp. MSJ-40]|uniref:ABC transporter permease n=1 Tax=Tissierella simiarum TaxID=2841534 RepID=A0ABS6E7X9_9FIRM|nr:hypothetical protein [Tissierella simiarum]MBU5438859.1 hypothetical protein [Tissierella simiarum]
MKDFKVLKILDIFKFIFEKAGIDYDVMRRILEIKFTLDGRRVPTIVGNSSSKKKDEDSNSFIKSLGVYLLLGIILVFFVTKADNYLYQMSFVFGILMFMMMTSLISDFSSVLLDIRDKNIILSKPVDSKTLNMAKVLHILFYMFFITISFSGPALIVSLFKQGGIFFLIFLAEIILMDLLIVVLTALLYLLVLKFFDGEKLKDIINYVQIALTIALSVGYQLLGRLFDFVDFKNVVFNPKWWQYFIPPIWFGAPFELILNNNRETYLITFSILALLVPIISIIIYVKLTPSFERNLQKLNSSGGKTGSRNNRITDFTSKLVCRSEEEIVFYRFATNMMKNERVFKLKVYPSLGFSIVFPFIFLFNGLRNGGLEGLVSSKMYFSIYFTALLIPTIVMNLGHSGNYKGAWIYRVVPFTDAKSIFKGTLKAALMNLILPLYILISIIFMIIFKGKIIVDLIIVFLNILLFMVICFRTTDKSLPFSKPFELAEQSQGFLVMIITFFTLGLLGLIHYLAIRTNYGSYIYIAALIIVNIVIWKNSFNIALEELGE